MSVQLILYPQNYNGQFNAVSNVADEKLTISDIFKKLSLLSTGSIITPGIIPDGAGSRLYC